MQKNKFLYYLKTKLESGKKAWFIVAAKDSIKLTLLQKKIADNSAYNLADYGTILHGGYELQAPQEILDSVNNQYQTEFTNN